MPICPHCHEEKSGSSFSRHKRACAKYPGDNELRDLYTKHDSNAAEVARQVGVSRPLMRQWLIGLGILDGQKRVPVKPKKKPVVVYRDLAAVRGKTGGCYECYRCELCRLWVHTVRRVACEGPLERELELWRELK